MQIFRREEISIFLFQEVERIGTLGHNISPLRYIQILDLLLDRLALNREEKKNV